MVLFRPFLLITALALTHFAYANNQEKQYKDNVNWAQSAQQNITSKASGQLSIEDLCSDAQCVHQVNNPPQKSLDDSSIESQKVGEFYSNENAGAIQNNFDKGRPNVKNDPSFEFALIGQENAFEITHGISNKYVDCNSGTQCTIEHTNKTCKIPTNNTVKCYEKPYVTDTYYKTGSYSFDYNGFTPINHKLPEGVTEISYIEFPSFLTCQGLVCAPAINNGVKVTLNNTVVFSAGFSNTNVWAIPERDLCKSAGNGGWCFAQYPKFSKAINIPLSNNQITINIPNDIGLFRGKFTIHYIQKSNILEWKSDCNGLLPQCNNVSRICIEPSETRILNGVETYLDCWKYELSYLCDLDNTCGQLSECEEVAKNCSLNLKGICIEQEVTKKCSSQRCSTTNLVCGETSFCLDGDCYNPMPKHNTEFDKSAAALAGLNAAAKDLGDPPTMFRGKPMKCTDGVFGFADCCKNRGWGTDLGLAQCDEEEKALGQAKEKKLTIDLGSYCAERVLGKCIRRKKTYCVYDSKMARIIQEQGNKNQLNSNFGSAKDPVCNPITPEQLQSINFEHIDFSDFYEDMHTNMELPDMEEIKNRLQSAFED